MGICVCLCINACVCVHESIAYVYPLGVAENMHTIIVNCIRIRYTLLDMSKLNNTSGDRDTRNQA